MGAEHLTPLPKAPRTHPAEIPPCGTHHGSISPSQPTAGKWGLSPSPIPHPHPNSHPRGDSGTVTPLSRGQSERLQIGFIFLIFLKIIMII